MWCPCCEEPETLPRFSAGTPLNPTKFDLHLTHVCNQELLSQLDVDVMDTDRQKAQVIDGNWCLAMILNHLKGLPLQAEAAAFEERQRPGSLNEISRFMIFPQSLHVPQASQARGRSESCAGACRVRLET